MRQPTFNDNQNFADEKLEPLRKENLALNDLKVQLEEQLKLKDV